MKKRVSQTREIAGGMQVAHLYSLSPLSSRVFWGYLLLSTGCRGIARSVQERSAVWSLNFARQKRRISMLRRSMLILPVFQWAVRQYRTGDNGQCARIPPKFPSRIPR